VIRITGCARPLGFVFVAIVVEVVLHIILPSKLIIIEVISLACLAPLLISIIILIIIWIVVIIFPLEWSLEFFRLRINPSFVVFTVILLLLLLNSIFRLVFCVLGLVVLWLLINVVEAISKIILKRVLVFSLMLGRLGVNGLLFCEFWTEFTSLLSSRLSCLLSLFSILVLSWLVALLFCVRVVSSFTPSSSFASPLSSLIIVVDCSLALILVVSLVIILVLSIAPHERLSIYCHWRVLLVLSVIRIVLELVTRMILVILPVVLILLVTWLIVVIIALIMLLWVEIDGRLLLGTILRLFLSWLSLFGLVCGLCSILLLLSKVFSRILLLLWCILGLSVVHIIIILVSLILWLVLRMPAPSPTSTTASSASSTPRL